MPTHTAGSCPTPTAYSLICHTDTHTTVLVQLMGYAFQTHIQIPRHPFSQVCRWTNTLTYLSTIIHICIHACVHITHGLTIDEYPRSSGSPFRCASTCCPPPLPSLYTSSPFLSPSFPLLLCLCAVWVISPVLIPAFRQPTGMS